MSLNVGEQIKTLISNDHIKEIDDLFKKIGNNKEFEFIFFSKKNQRMNKEKYILMLKYIRTISRSKKLRVVGPEKTLDISIELGENERYRISVGEKELKRCLLRLNEQPNKNYLIFRFMYLIMKRELEVKDNDQYNLISKRKESDSTIDLDELMMRVRLSEEEDLKKTIVSGDMSQYNSLVRDLISGKKFSMEEAREMNKRIVFRLKERTSLYIEESEDHFIRVDLTDTKTTNNLKHLDQTYSNYELEIEYGLKNSSDSKKGVVKKEHLDLMYGTAESLLKLIQQSSFLITTLKEQEVVEYYKEQLGVTEQIGNLVARQPISLEIQHVTEIIPNKYCVTDKADGDRYHMIIFNNGVYLISTNLNVKDTGIILDKKLSQYNGTVLDGEYIFIPSEHRHLFMIFDCLKVGDKDMRQIVRFADRIKGADEVVEKCMIFKGQKGFEHKEMPEQKNGFDINAVRTFYGNELVRFHDSLLEDGKVMKTYPLIRRKYFMHVFGAHKWEIFDYLVEYWKGYSENSRVHYKYHLDGLILQPSEQSYNTNARDSKYHELKWKPVNKNSIDFYIEFKRDPMTGEILDCYDNSEEDVVRNKPYRICTLFVGKSTNNVEHPVPFTENYGISEAYLYLKDGELRDTNQDIISDKTVVEFYYQNDPSIIPQRRWVPIKTRFDKTESVEKYGKKYGNYVGIAERIWRSIGNPVLMSDFAELARGNTDKHNYYDIKIKEMNDKISHSLIIASAKENKYYQQQSKLAEVMRQYHNFIKSNIIYTYCNKMYQSNKQQSVLDIACGQGGDIGKFYYAEVAYYVGLDLDEQGLKSPLNGAISRYERFRKKKPNFPKMYFIQADCRAKLEYDMQMKALSGMDMGNKELLEKFFPSSNSSGKKSMFDIINCQFAIHYFLKDRLSWENFKSNISSHLRNGGYFLATTFDAQKVIESIGSGENFQVTYDDMSGANKVFFDVKKKYGELIRTKSGTIDCGNAIDLFASWMFEDGNYQTEYLVDIDFVKQELERDCDMELVDTDLFENQLIIHRTFLTDSARYESVGETREYLANVANYYDDTEMNLKCREYTKMHRYFVFRKRTKKPEKQKGGKIEELYNFNDMEQFRIPNMANYDDRHSMLNSVHNILVTHEIIPKSVRVEQFISDMGMSVVDDERIGPKYINQLTNNILVNHEIPDPKDSNKLRNVRVLDGLNILVVERDCNDMYDIEYSIKNKEKSSDRAIILLKEGGLYKPVMKKLEKGRSGIFRMNDEMIRHLIDNGQSMV